MLIFKHNYFDFQPKKKNLKTKHNTICFDTEEFVFKHNSGFVGVAFTIGSLSVWFPQFIALGYVIRGEIAPCQSETCEYSDIMFTFGLITTISGLGGVAVGLFSSNKMKAAGNARADAEICATGQFLMGVCTCFAIFSCLKYRMLTWAFGLVGMIGGCVNWALMVNMTMETCIPKRRATANAVQMFLGHALGDAISPILIGAIADSLTTYPEFTSDASYLVDFQSLKYGMLLCPLASVMGGMFFLLAAGHIEEDKKRVNLYIKTEGGMTESTELTVSSGSSQASDNARG